MGIEADRQQRRVDGRTSRERPLATPRERLHRLYPWIAIGVILAFWEASVRMSGINSLVLPRPTAIAQAMYEKREVLADFSITTLFEILAGFAAAFLIGVPLGVLVFFNQTSKNILYPLLVASQMVPKVAIAPVFVIWLGLGLASKVVIAFLIAFFPVMVSTIVGLEAVDPEMVRLFRSMGGGALITFLKLRLPTALPNIFAGLKVGMSLAVVGAIVGEFVSSNEGLGYYLLYADGQMDTVGVFAALVLLTLIGVILYFIVEWVERLFVSEAQSKDAGAGHATM